VIEIVTCIFLWIGAIFILLASVGVIRFRDVYMRMHAATKTGTVGISSIVLGLAVHFQDFEVTISAFLIVAFFLVTAPISAHVIGRAAYFLHVPISSGLLRDDLARDLAERETTTTPAAEPENLD
jgi:multicomponent Na+:H+ antiporter subunit G